ncbi:MAG: hypothetical protein WD691_00635 [Acidimicrobiales bacterium]
MAVVGLAALLASGCESGTPIGRDAARRVLIVSMPGVSWTDVRTGHLPTLAALSQGSGIADLAIRIGRQRTTSTAAYLTIGAGTRAVAPAVERAVALDPDETYEGVRAAQILQRRLGMVPTGSAYLAVGAAQDRNEQSSFGAEPGRLGDALARASVGRAVIANADAAEAFESDEPTPDGAYARSAMTALMGSDGVVPGGTVGRELLRADPTAPYGRSLDPSAVLEAFDAAWSAPGRSVVLVETSDLSRAAGYSLRSTVDQGRKLRESALGTSDQLLGDLLERTDPERDAVLVVSPVAAPGAPDLTIAVLRAPGLDGGLLRSATTRRAGYVQLADVAPTVLALLGEDPPVDMEGRAFEMSAAGGDRVKRLVDESAAAEFRDRLIPVVVPGVIAVLALLVLATVIVWRRRPRYLPAMRDAALCALGVVPASFLLGRVGSLVDRMALYLLALVALAVAIGAVAAALDRRRPGAGALVGTGSIVALVCIDVLAGAPLQLNSVFGYSVAVAGRFAGIGNLAFSLFGSAAIVVAALLIDRYGRRALPWVVGLLAGVVMIEGLPMLGADIGGVVSMVPAFGVTALVLSARRVRVVDAVLLGVATALAVVGFAFIDAAGPAGSQTHLARLAEHLQAGRIESLTDTLHRRLQASFGEAELAAWALIVLLIISVGTYAVLRVNGWLDRLAVPWTRGQPTVAAGAGLALLALIGLVANDSSIAVPSTMLIVIVPVLLVRAIASVDRSVHLDMRTG